VFPIGVTGLFIFILIFSSSCLQNAKSWNPTNYCKGYYIETLLWRAKSRELSPVGHADFNGNVVLNSEIFPNIKYGYNKRWFLISTLEVGVSDTLFICIFKNIQ
jgi:hypothetical protein